MTFNYAMSKQFIKREIYSCGICLLSFKLFHSNLQQIIYILYQKQSIKFLFKKGNHTKVLADIYGFIISSVAFSINNCGEFFDMTVAFTQISSCLPTTTLLRSVVTCSVASVLMETPQFCVVENVIDRFDAGILTVMNHQNHI